MTDSSDAVQPLATILAEHGALSVEDLAERLLLAGISDPDAVIHELLGDDPDPVEMVGFLSRRFAP